MLSHPVISKAWLDKVIRWSGLLRWPSDAKQDPVVYDAEFGAVFLAKGLHTSSIQWGIDCLGLHHSGVEEECHFRPVVELT